MLPPDAALAGDPDALLERLDGPDHRRRARRRPGAYGAEPHPRTDPPRSERDEFEIALARRAMERDLPLLGICRGMQVMNVARGGTLVQDLPEHVGHENAPPVARHVRGQRPRCALASCRCAAAAGETRVLVEARDELAGAASGTNSGILHTGFDPTMDALETRLILRSAELRGEVVAALGVPVRRCGALVRGGEAANGVRSVRRADGTLEIPDESIVDPVRYTRALAAAAVACGAEVHTGIRVADRHEVPARVTVNCAGLHADEVARLFGDDSFRIYPRKGEFFVYDGLALDRILLPAPTGRTKGVLVFPTLDGKVVAGPTAHDQEDKDDWSVRPEAFAEVREKAADLLPEIADAEPIAAWAGLRPAGRGCNYVIGRSRACPELVNVAAIRSTGVTASLAIAERVAELILPGAAERPLPAGAAPASEAPWWQAVAS